MKHISSMFLEDEEYKKLKELKEKKSMTWKDLMLSTLEK